MDVSQKVDNQLNLALDIPENERSDSPELNLGYLEENNTWELIVRYTGSLERIKNELDIQVTELMNNFAIIVIKEPLIPALEAFEEIIFIEKPKLLSFEVNTGIAVSCLEPLQESPLNLSGKGVLVAVIDSGIDYSHPDFRNADGTSRILYLWDQTIAGDPPAGYFNGTEYTKAEIDEALNLPNPAERLRIVPSTDLIGHGTHVAGICCGNGRASDGVYRGVAYESDMIVVKLGPSVHNSFPSTSQLMEAINYVIGKSLELNQPIVVNISFGNSYGSHAGNSLLESFIDLASDVGRTNIVIGTGNEGASGRHYQTTLLNNQTSTIEIAVGEGEQSLNLQLWRYPYDYFDVSIIGPDGKRVGPINRTLGSQRVEISNTNLYIYYGEPNPYSINQETYFLWLPKEQFVTSGIWTVEITTKRIVSGSIFMWLPTGAASRNTKFVQPSVEITLTIPSTASSAISVGAYDAYTDSIAYFSGRGYTITGEIKPDLVAPGVNITSCAIGGGYTSRTGTSMATPFVTGSAALLMQWGILEGNDKYLYGEKIKAYLIITARPLKSYTQYPNETIGFGALCLSETPY